MNNIEIDILTERIQLLEENMMTLTADIQHLSDAMRDAQRVIVKIATSQQQIVERVGHWPYVKVRTDDPDIDK